MHSRRERGYLPVYRWRQEYGGQGQGHACSLLLFVLMTAWRASREVGSFGVLTHPD